MKLFKHRRDVDRGRVVLIGAFACVLILANIGNGWTQPFRSGSTGADGAFAPTVDMTVSLPPNGVFHYTTVTIPAGVTVTFAPNAAKTPVTILATGDVTIDGTMSVNGQSGTPGATTGPAVLLGGAPGPGGFRGGQGGGRSVGHTIPSAGLGPGGGRLPVMSGLFLCGVGGQYGTPPSFTSFLPLFGGSGGGGQNATAQSPASNQSSASSGGGGGGAMVIASSMSISINGSISANGGDGGSFNNRTASTAGNGSGGAIRLVAPTITGAGTLRARGGLTLLGGCNTGGNGRIQLEGTTLGFTGSSIPSFSSLTTPEPVVAGSTPPVVLLPTLRISSVGNIAAPATPAGSYDSVDITLPQDGPGAVPVVLTATNTPVPTTFTIRLLPQFRESQTVTAVSSPQNGTFSQSTATTFLTFPAGLTTVIHAWAEFDLPSQIAALLPPLGSDPVERIMVASTHGDRSGVSFITQSGRIIPADHLLGMLRHAP